MKSRKEYNKKYYEDNKERYRKQHKKWYDDNQPYIQEYREKNKEHRKKYMKQWTTENKDYIKKGEKDKRDKWIELFKTLGYTKCSKCGYDKCFAAIDFHHKKPNKKNKSVGSLIRLVLNEKNKQKVLTEIKKCEVLCANCHRELHFD